MKFSIAKKDDIECQGCHSYIMRGEDMVLTFLKKNNMPHPKILCYHTVCYIPWYTDMFNRKWSEWKEGDGNRVQPPKKGRPVTYTKPTKEQVLNRLRSIKSYHKKRGHTRMVAAMEERIKKVHLLLR